ncbi:MAG: PBSX family phage terminase large subunit [Candidatus Cryptobacteroides sp.]
MQTTRVFDKTSAAWLIKPRYLSLCGGTRSGKTYSVLQLFILVLLGEERRGAKATVNSICSESIPHLKRGCIRDFKTIMQAEGLWDANRWNESDKTYKFRNGSILEFFSVDNAGKVFGASRDRLFVNECQHIDYETFRQLAVRTRGMIVVDYNPTHHFWVMDKVESKDNCIRIHSTYEDNVFLSDAQRREIEDNRSDANWWRVYGQGLEGSLEGLIYEFETIDRLPELSEFDKLVEVQGLDFGFTNDPTARVQVYADRRTKTAYIRERCYETHLQNKHIVEDLSRDGVGRMVPIYADCAEPKSIADIIDGGFNVIPCDKDAPVKSDKMKFQLQWMQAWKLYVTKDSVNLINELRNYTWMKDKDGNTLNQPIDKYNHLLDALRYALWTHFGRDAGYGQYSVSFNVKKKDERRHH